MIVDSNCSLASFCLLLFARFCRGNRAQVVRVRQGPSKRAQTQPGAPDPRSKESEALSEKVARRARVEGLVCRLGGVEELSPKATCLLPDDGGSIAFGRTP